MTDQAVITSASVVRVLKKLHLERGLDGGGPSPTSSNMIRLGVKIIRRSFSSSIRRMRWLINRITLDVILADH
ncbi:hypothetical protein ACVDG5_006030 [Mesorhizobium sp. ORM6]